jgi:hypothetical protein
MGTKVFPNRRDNRPTPCCDIPEEVIDISTRRSLRIHLLLKSPGELPQEMSAKASRRSPFFFLTFRSYRRFLSYSSHPPNFGWQHPFSPLGKNPVVASLSQSCQRKLLIPQAYVSKSQGALLTTFLFIYFFFFLTFRSFRRFLSYSSYPLNFGWRDGDTSSAMTVRVPLKGRDNSPTSSGDIKENTTWILLSTETFALNYLASFLAVIIWFDYGERIHLSGESEALFVSRHWFLLIVYSAKGLYTHCVWGGGDSTILLYYNATKNFNVNIFIIFINFRLTNSWFTDGIWG